VHHFFSYLKEVQCVFVETLVECNHAFVPLVEFVLSKMEGAGEDEQSQSRVSSCVPIKWRVISYKVGTLRPAMTGRGRVDGRVETRRRERERWRDEKEVEVGVERKREEG